MINFYFDKSSLFLMEELTIDHLAKDNFNLIIKFLCEIDPIEILNFRRVCRKWNNAIYELWKFYDKKSLYLCFLEEDTLGVLKYFTEYKNGKREDEHLFDLYAYSKIIGFKKVIKLFHYNSDRFQTRFMPMGGRVCEFYGRANLLRLLDPPKEGNKTQFTKQLF